VHISQGVTSHGFAWNITADLRDFDLIIPCGIGDRAVTSLEQEIDESRAAMPTMEAARHAAARHFGRIFGRQILWLESLETLLVQTQAPEENAPEHRDASVI
jgi:lipoyl(octanoyl) transferase